MQIHKPHPIVHVLDIVTRDPFDLHPQMSLKIVDDLRIEPFVDFDHLGR